MLNKLLQRQIQKHFGNPDQVPVEFTSLLKVISEAYDHYERERKMLERSIELSSDEMIGLHTRLRNEAAELKEKNRELNLLFTNIAEVMFSVDMISYRLTHMSPACDKIYGYSAEEFLSNGDLWQSVIHPGDRHISFQQVDLLNKGKRVFNQYRIIHKNGEIRWIENKVIPTLDADGRLVRLDGLTTDITEKRKSAQKLLESEVRFRSLIENSADMLTMMNEQGAILYESPAVLRSLGYAQGENTDRPGFELIYSDDKETALKVFDEAMKSPGTPVPLAVRMNAKQDGYIFAEGHLTNLLDIPGINAVVTNFRDVTERVKAERNFAESRDKYKLVYENPFLGIAIGSIEGTVQNVNEAFCRMLGYTQDELYNKHFSFFTPPEDLEKELPYVQRMANGEIKNYQLEKRYITKSQKLIWVDLSISCVKDAYGKIQSLVAVVQDITPQKLSEELLHKSEANLRNILENTDTAYVLLDENAFILSYNRLAKELAAEEMQETLEEGKNYIDIMLPGRREEVARIIREVLSKRESTRYEVKYEGNGKPSTWLLVGIHPIMDKSGRLLGMSIAATNITARKNAEQQIKQSNERYELAGKATNDAIWDWNLVTGEVYWSDAYEKLFGYRKAQEPMVDLYSSGSKIHPTDRERVTDSITHALTAKETYWESEYKFIKSNKEIAHVSDRGYIIYDEHKKPVRMVGAMRDITAEKSSALERDKITMDLIRQNKDLEQFAYIVSHNLRAPLANIAGLSRIIQDGNLNEQSRKLSMEGLTASVQKLDDVIMDLSHILQVKRGINENKELVHFSSLVEDIKLSIRNHIEQEGVIIRTDFSAVDEIFSLKSYIYSIFYNLISNSIKYRHQLEKPLIEISSRETADKTVLVFRDNGRGIDMEKYSDKVFGLYKRFHYNVEGKGMGLFMVKTQVETLDGKISITSTVNKGTTFTIEFKKQAVSPQIPHTVEKNII